MNQLFRTLCSLVLITAMVACGCKPMQPFYLMEDGDLSHYLDVATQIEYPDVEEPSLDEVTDALSPLTLENAEDYEVWELSLQEVVNITLCNSQVIRNIGGQVTASPGLSPGIEVLTRNIVQTLGVTTVYDPALVESGYGAATGSPLSGTGVEAALAEFDAQLDASVFWEKNRSPQNRPDTGPGADLFPPIFAQDLGIFTAGISKTTPDGTTWRIANNTNYEGNNVPTGGATPFRALHSDWRTNFEASFSTPLLQGRGLQYNRIAGPLTFEQYAAGFINPIDGVVIARIRTDQTLADFEGNIRDLLQDVEGVYWELYFRYRDLDAKKIGRDSALESWRTASSLLRSGLRGGERARVAQAESQYFQFRAQVQQALTDLFRTERRLRYIMGLSPSDGRLIRPADEPIAARVAFEWNDLKCEALARRVEIRRQKWEIKKRELELIAARNSLLPRIDAVGRYRWLGLGDDLISPARGASAFNEPGSTAFGVLTSGEFQEWQLGLQASIPIGYRQELAGVRHQELLLARERAVLLDLENEVIHQLSEALSDIDLNHALTQSFFSRRKAADEEVAAVKAEYEAGRLTLDLLLDAQRRRAEAESDYFRSLIDYNRAIMRVHYRKGSLLDYDGVFLAEGPWPGKAYFDALRRARKRDASMYLDYGYARPNVISRGPYQQLSGEGHHSGATSEIGGGGPRLDGELLPEPGGETGDSLPTLDERGPRMAPPEIPDDTITSSLPAPLIAARQRALAADEHQTDHTTAQATGDAPVGHGGWR